MHALVKNGSSVTHVDGLLEGPDFVAAVAELEERDEREWQLERQHHLHATNNQAFNQAPACLPSEQGRQLAAACNGDDEAGTSILFAHRREDDELASARRAADDGDDEAGGDGDGARGQVPHPALHPHVQEPLQIKQHVANPVSYAQFSLSTI
jgi:hypothetical protein